MAETDISRITAGVDTHKDTHTAAALDSMGRALGTATFSATAKGYALLLDWLRSFGVLERVGIEGTGSYGAGLTRYLGKQGVPVVEVNRPNRQSRRRNGKSDPADAEAAARATLAGEAIGSPKSQDGMVEAIRILRLERKSAIQSRTQAGNQLHAVVSTAPEPLRTERRRVVSARETEGANPSRSAWDRDRSRGRSVGRCGRQSRAPGE